MWVTYETKSYSGESLEFKYTQNPDFACPLDSGYYSVYRLPHA